MKTATGCMNKESKVKMQLDRPVFQHCPISTSDLLVVVVLMIAVTPIRLPTLQNLSDCLLRLRTLPDK